MAKTKIIETEVISVSPEAMREIRSTVTNAEGKPLSNVTIYNALRFTTNSAVAKQIRQEALRLGGRKIKKPKVVFA